MDNPKKYGSGEYSPTESHSLPAFSRSIQGFICPACGHLETSLEDSPYDNLCSRCVVVALRRLGVPVMMTIKDYHMNLDEALEPTAKVIKPKPLATTVIVKKN